MYTAAYFPPKKHGPSVRVNAPEEVTRWLRHWGGGTPRCFARSAKSIFVHTPDLGLLFFPRRLIYVRTPNVGNYHYSNAYGVLARSGRSKASNSPRDAPAERDGEPKTVYHAIVSVEPRCLLLALTISSLLLRQSDFGILTGGRFRRPISATLRGNARSLPSKQIKNLWELQRSGSFW